MATCHFQSMYGWVLCGPGLRVHRDIFGESPNGHCLEHNHPVQKEKQKKYLAPLEMSQVDIELILDLGKSFVPPPNVVNFMRNRRTKLTAKHVQSSYDQHGYGVLLRAHLWRRSMRELSFFKFSTSF